MERSYSSVLLRHKQQMKFTTDKCKVTHMGKKTSTLKYWALSWLIDVRNKILELQMLLWKLHLYKQ